MAKKSVFAAFSLLIASYLALNSLMVPAIGAKESPNLPPQSVGLLPTNPFYFIKEWGRSIKRTLTFDLIRKADWDLDVLQSKLAELKKLEFINVDINALNLAAQNYRQSTLSLSEHLRLLKNVSHSVELSNLLDKLADRLLRHELIFQDLLTTTPSDEELFGEIILIQSNLSQLAVWVMENLESAEDFGSRLQSTSQGINTKSKSLRIAEIFSRWERGLSGKNRQEFLSLKEEFLIDFVGQLEAVVLSSGTAALPDIQVSLSLLDEMRYLVNNQDLKNYLTVIRQRFLDKIKLTIDEKLVLENFASAEELIQELEALVKADKSLKFLQQILAAANFSLNQVEELLAKENYGNAFGQVVTASTAAKNGLIQATWSLEEVSAVLKKLAGDYDRFYDKAINLGLTEENSPAIFDLFVATEKTIAETSRALNREAGLGKLIIQIREIKILLATIHALLGN